MKVRPQFVKREREEETVIGCKRLYSLGVDNEVSGVDTGGSSQYMMLRARGTNFVVDTWDFGRAI